MTAPARGDEQLPDDPFPDPDTEFERAAAFNREVAEELRRQQVREAARRQLERGRAGTQARPPVLALAEFLATPDDDVAYLVDRLWPVGGRVILAAQYKAGKTTLTGNLIRSLADGVPFLGQFTMGGSRRVVLIDDELDQGMLRRWLRAQGIHNTEAVKLVALRGRTGTFDLLDPERRAEWAAALRGADVIILDCLRPVLDALGLDENRDAGRFLVAFDALLQQTGAREALVVHHMGHNGERSRGDSRIVDWPDATWKLVREDPEEPSSPRYFSAFGRDVDVTETRLAYEEPSRRLSVAGGSRKEARAEEAIPAITQLLQEHDQLSGRQVEALLADSALSRSQIRAGLAHMHGQGLTFTFTGLRNSTMHTLKPNECASAP